MNFTPWCPAEISDPCSKYSNKQIGVGLGFGSTRKSHVYGPMGRSALLTGEEENARLIEGVIYRIF